MSHEVYYQFPQTDGQARRGGKTTARHRRERLEGRAAEVAARRLAGPAVPVGDHGGGDRAAGYPVPLVTGSREATLAPFTGSRLLKAGGPC